MEDARSQRNFWYKLEQFKFELLYYDAHFGRCVKIPRRMRFSISIATALAAGAWMSWYNIVWVNTVCLIIVLLLQAMNAVIELMPFEKRKSDIRELANELLPLYNKMERDWASIANGDLTNDEIEDMSFSYAHRHEEIRRHYFKDDSLPPLKTCKKKAKEEADAYFKNFS